MSDTNTDRIITILLDRIDELESDLNLSNVMKQSYYEEIQAINQVVRDTFTTEESTSFFEKVNNTRWQ